MRGSYVLGAVLMLAAATIGLLSYVWYLGESREAPVGTPQPFVEDEL